MPDEIKWIKLSVGFFGDDKIKQIRAMPDGDAMLLIWLNLLVMAGKTNDGGLIYLTQGVPYTDEMLSVALNRPIMTVRCALETFTMLRMVECMPEGLLISNWEKHQNIDGMDKVREQTKNRVRNCRERKRLEAGQKKDCNVTVALQVTQRNADVTVQNKNKREDIEKEEYILYAPPLYDTEKGFSNTVQAGAGENEVFEGVNGNGSDTSRAYRTCETESGRTGGFAGERPGIGEDRLRRTEKGPLDWRDLSKDRLY